MTLKCFVAMAFDRKDTEHLYDKAIKPVLKSKGIIPFRVDRSTRNDDIDDQIMAELAKCDFVIADLTYARPSVYFEAGVAQGRPVEVIYTCRRDHFKQRPDDHHGNYRVHFDLQMKPIIKWDDPLQGSFSRQLAKRLAHVIRPILKRRQKEQAATKDSESFSRLSIREQRDTLKQIWMKAVHRAGFRQDGEEKWPVRKMSGRTHVVTGTVLDKLTKAVLQSAVYWVGTLAPLHVRERLALRQRATIHIYYISLAKITQRMMAEALPHFRVTAFRGELTAKSSTVSVSLGQNPFRFRSGLKLHGAPEKAEVPVVFHVIAGVDSTPMFKQTITHSLERIR